MRTLHMRSATRRRLSRSAPALALLASLVAAAPAARSASADEPYDEELAVRVTPSVVLAAQDVRAVITVPRRPENRRLVVTVEAPAYYAATERQLDGEAAALLHELAFRHLPEGEYRVRVVVESGRGPDADVETRFSVRGAALDPVASAGPMP